MKITKIEYNGEETTAKLFINNEAYGIGITKFEISGYNEFKVYTDEGEKERKYELPEGMHRVYELEKYDNITIVEE